jgi:hypothetical protein
VYSRRIKEVFGENSIVFSPTILSRKCSERYNAVGAQLSRADCLSYDGAK